MSIFTRVRQRDMAKNAYYTLSWKNRYTGEVTVFPPYGGASPSTGQNQVVYDNKTARFIPGKCCCHPVEMRKSVGFSNPGSITFKGTYYELTDICQSGDILAQHYALESISLAPTWDSSREKAMLARAYAGIAKPDAEVGVMLGEANQTLQMIRNPLQGVGNLVKKWLKPTSKKTKRNKRARNAMDLEDRLANSWLMYRYGILTGMSDVDALRRSYTKDVSDMGTPLRRSTASWTSSRTSNSTSKATIGVFTINVDTQITTSVKTSAGCYYRFLLSDDNSARNLGVSPLDIPAVMWELVPYSFVADWVLGVSDWIRNSIPNPKVRYEGNYVSQVDVSSTLRSAGQAILAWTGKPAEGSAGSFYTQKSTLMRMAHLPVPDVPVPTIEVLNLARSLDSISLGLNAIKGLIKRPDLYTAPKRKPRHTKYNEKSLLGG